MMTTQYSIGARSDFPRKALRRSMTGQNRAERELPTADIHDEPSHPDWLQGVAAEPRKT